MVHHGKCGSGLAVLVGGTPIGVAGSTVLAVAGADLRCPRCSVWGQGHGRAVVRENNAYRLS